MLLVVFNRLDVTLRTLDAIRAARPARLYVAADGPRPGVLSDAASVREVREAVLRGIDWPCVVQTLFREENLGCKVAVSGAISWFFDHEPEGIILEDDCVASRDFFRFCDWGLEAFRDEERVGSVSGSNLIADRASTDARNGFSAFMNPWGWATWKEVWDRWEGTLDDDDLREVRSRLQESSSLSWWQAHYWMTQFRHIRGSDTVWDMFLQFQFFVEGLISVYPAENLVLNIGFGEDSTHTTGSTPAFVRRNDPAGREGDLMQRPPDLSCEVDHDRDDVLTGTIWRCTPLGTLRFSVGHLVRQVV